MARGTFKQLRIKRLALQSNAYKGGGGSEHYKIIHNSHELPRRCIKKQITHINEIHSVS